MLLATYCVRAGLMFFLQSYTQQIKCRKYDEQWQMFSTNPLSLCWIFEKSFNSSNIQVNLTLNYYGLNEKLGFSNALFSPGRINSKRLKEFVLLSKTYFVMFPKPFTLSLLRVRVLRNSQNYVKVLAKPQSYRFLEFYTVSVSKDKNNRSKEVKKEFLTFFKKTMTKL